MLKASLRRLFPVQAIRSQRYVKLQHFLFQPKFSYPRQMATSQFKNESQASTEMASESVSLCEVAPLPAVRTTSLSPDQSYLFNYTAGRWLKHDELERDARFIKFDFAALCEKAVQHCPGATKVVCYEKHEGGYNRAFILSMDNGSQIVARLPTRIAGPARLTTNSEVATMTYLKTHTSIPVPGILDWSDDKSNPIGAEYIIMEHAVGVRLHDVWPTMNVVQQMQCIRKLSMVMEELAKISWPAYGSLYFKDAPIESSSKIDFVDGFCVGPHCGTMYWDVRVREAKSYDGQTPNRGPWSDLHGYCCGLIDTGLSGIPVSDIEAGEQLPHQGSVDEHRQLLRVCHRTLEELIKSPLIQKAAIPVLLHADFHKRNIFVSEHDPTIVTSLIDWQSTSIEPAFLYASDTPDFAYISPDYTFLKASGEDKPKEELEDSEDEKDRKENLLLCYQTYDVCMKGFVLHVRAARILDDGLFRLFRYCHASWRYSATALRQQLVELARDWNVLGLDGSCPYSPTEEELAVHRKRFEDFETIQKLTIYFMRGLCTDSEGWVPVDAWDETKKLHKKAYELYMQAARVSETEGGEGNITVDVAKKWWPFDEP